MNLSKQILSRDSVLLNLNKISIRDENDKQLISYLVTQMQSTDKFIGFAAAKAMYSVLSSNKELAVHSLALTRLFNDIQATFMHMSLFVEFSLEMMSKLLKKFQNDQVNLSGVCQLHFECLQKLWPTLLKLQFGDQHTVSMVPFLSLTCTILKFKFAKASCCNTERHHVEFTTVSACQSSISDICCRKVLPQLLNHCSNLFEMKKCLGLFNTVCDNGYEHHGVCDDVLDNITSSSLVKSILLKWLLLPLQSVDIYYIRDLFGVNITATSLEVDDMLVATVVRKLMLLVMKCLSITVDKGKGIDWLCQFEHFWKVPAAANNCEYSLRNVLLEILLDHDSAMVDAFCYCLKITQVVNRKCVSIRSVICSVLDINMLFVKFLHAISYDHLVLVDYVISDETCFVDFLKQYLEYVYNNWSAFISSHHKLQDTMKVQNNSATTAAYCETRASSLLSRKRKHGHHSSVVSQNVLQLEQTTKSLQLVAYDLSDSSEDENMNRSMLHDTMSCIIRLRLALERMLAKKIIPNLGESTELVSMIETVESLYETTD